MDPKHPRRLTYDQAKTQNARLRAMLAAKAEAEAGAVTEITSTDVDELTAFFLSLNDIDKSQCRSIDDPTIFRDV